MNSVWEVMRMKCLKCQKTLNKDGRCICGFSLSSNKTLFTRPLSASFLKEVQDLFAVQGDFNPARLAKLSATQLYRMATEIIQKEDGNPDYTQAAACYRVAAEKGHAEAQFCLGSCYENGIGVVKSHAEAMKWYELAAQQRIPRAQYRLGWLYRNGWDVKRDDKKSVEWLEKAAYAGIVEAQHLLGWMFRNGSGVKTDTARAAKWMRLAAEQGHVEAARTYQYMRMFDKSI